MSDATNNRFYREKMPAPGLDLKEIAFIICNEIKSDIDPRDADRAAAEIAKYLAAMADVADSSGVRALEDKP